MPNETLPHPADMPAVHDPETAFELAARLQQALNVQGAAGREWATPLERRRLAAEIRRRCHRRHLRQQPPAQRWIGSEVYVNLHAILHLV